MTDMTIQQLINGSRGATVAGPRNLPLEAQVPDIFAAPLTDHGSMPNLHFPFAFAHSLGSSCGFPVARFTRSRPLSFSPCGSPRAVHTNSN